MKEMTKETQMQANGGGVWVHCHKCGYEYYASTKEKARNKILAHIKLKGHTGVAFWDYGLLRDCPNY